MKEKELFKNETNLVILLKSSPQGPIKEGHANGFSHEHVLPGKIMAKIILRWTRVSCWDKWGYLNVTECDYPLKIILKLYWLWHTFLTCHWKEKIQITNSMELIQFLREDSNSMCVWQQRGRNMWMHVYTRVCMCMYPGTSMHLKGIKDQNFYRV